MTEPTENIQEYIEELDAIIEEYNELDPEEQKDSADFHQEIMKLRSQFDVFETLSEEEQEKTLQSAEAMFFSISLFSDLDEEDFEDLTEWDEDDFTEDFENGELTPEFLENISKILISEEDDPEAIAEIQKGFEEILSKMNPNDKTIPITEK